MTKKRGYKPSVEKIISENKEPKKENKTFNEFNDLWGQYIKMFQEVTGKNIKNDKNLPKARRQIKELAAKGIKLSQLEKVVRNLLKLAPDYCTLEYCSRKHAIHNYKTLKKPINKERNQLIINSNSDFIWKKLNF